VLRQHACDLPLGGDSPHAGLSALSGSELAALLAQIDPAAVADYDLVEVIAAYERLAAWAAAGQVEAVAELSRRSVYSGGALSPTRLAGMEVAARLRLAPSTGEHRVNVAQTLIDCLPSTFVALRDGVIDYRRAAALAEAVAGLTREQAVEVEARVLPKAGTRSLGRHRAAVERAVLEVDPRGAEERHEIAVRQRRIEFSAQPVGMASAFVFMSGDGMATLRAMLDAAAIAIRANHPGDVRTMDQLRVDALVEMAARSVRTGRLGGDPDGLRLATMHGRRALIQVTVPYSTLLGLDEQPAELTGYGPIPASVARRIAADGTWRRLLTDPATGAVLNYGKTRYQPPQDLVDHVVARDRRCRFPACGQPAHRCQLDHSVAHPDGPTAASNLGPLCVPHHESKTSGGWQLGQPRPGWFTWTSPVGQVYEIEPEAVGPIVQVAGPDSHPPSADGHRPRARDP